jgi:oligopeptidase B
MTRNLLSPPVVKVVPHTYQHLNWSLTDDYAWLEDKADPEVVAYLEAENAYTRSALQHTEPLQEHLYQEMRGRIPEDDRSAPERRGEYWYYWRIGAGQQYRVFCRKHGSLDAPEQVLVDENALAEGKSYCRVFVFEPSPDHNLLAYSVDFTGAAVFDLYILDMRSGILVDGPIPNTAYTAAWASDSRTLFNTTFDGAHRPFKLWRHATGTSPDTDVLVYHEANDAFNVTVNRTRSGAYVLLTIASQSTSEVRYLPADRPTNDLKIIEPRRPWVEYYVEHHGDRFLIRTNRDQAENFKLVEAPVTAPGQEHWRTVIPHRPDTLIEGLAAFRNHLAVYERRGGLRHIRLSGPDALSNVRYVAFPEPTYTVFTGTYSADVNHEFDTSILRFQYSSLVTPDSTIDYDVDREQWHVTKKQEIPSGYDPAQYASERLLARAPDGAQVPISLVYRRGLVRDSHAPLLLEGYGSYGFSREPGFDPLRLSLLDRGFIYAIAHIRGGSELGRAWYEQGRLMHKKNTFSDFIACAEHLIVQGYTSPEHLAIMGASAGGLLMGTVVNERPELFRAVVARVPFTNVISAMLKPDLPLTVIEYEQWGNPNDAQAFAYMLSYSPYENVKAQAYPHILAKGGLNDLQVPYWDPAKWVAKLRARKTDSNRLLLVTNMGAGHGGASGRYELLREVAQVFAFLIDALGVEEVA